MPNLSSPTPNVRASFLAAMDELRHEQGGVLDVSTTSGRETREWRGRWETAEGFAAYIAALGGQPEGDPSRPAGWVSGTTWWWVEGREYLGRIDLRHRLTDHLRRVGGHVGYTVRPSARRQGHATAMLAAVLPHARAMGISPVLVTCDVDNVASRRVIEANGGELEDELVGKLRYWVPS
jgi:predicted acetyltransferase